MTLEMIAKWYLSWPVDVSALDPLPATIQAPKQMIAEIPTRLPAMRKLADQLYSVWIRGLKAEPEPFYVRPRA